MMDLTLYKKEKLVIKAMNKVSSVDNGNIYNQNHMYFFFQNLILFVIYFGNKPDYFKRFLYVFQWEEFNNSLNAWDKNVTIASVIQGGPLSRKRK